MVIWLSDSDPIGLTILRVVHLYGDLTERNLDRSTELSIYFLCGGKFILKNEIYNRINRQKDS